MRWITRIGLALTLGLGGSAWSQDSKDDENTIDDVDIDALLADEEPKGEEPADEPEAETEAEPEPTDQEKADKDSLSLVSYQARAAFDSLYFGHTLVRAERHLGHVDVYFLTQDGKKMMAEVRPDGSLGKVEKASF